MQLRKMEDITHVCLLMGIQWKKRAKRKEIQGYRDSYRNKVLE